MQRPVFLELKRLTEANLDLKQLIVREFETCSFPRAAEFTNRALRQGRLLILLDGLDEVSTDNLTNAICMIQDFVDQYKRNRFIASCRTAAYRTGFRQFTDVAMADFDDVQIEQFITNWFSSPEDQQGQKAQTCWEVLQRLENESAKELARTPLLLTFLCFMFGVWTSPALSEEPCSALWQSPQNFVGGMGRRKSDYAAGYL